MQEAERAEKAAAKESARLYAESRLAQVENQNRELIEYIQELETLLQSTLQKDDYLDLEALKGPAYIRPFNPGELAIPLTAPNIDQYLPAPLSRVSRLVPGAKERYQQQVDAATREFEVAFQEYQQRESERVEALEQARAQYGADARNSRARVDKLKEDLAAGVPTAVTSYVELVLERSEYPDSFPRASRIAYIQESKQVVVEIELPGTDVIPEAASYSYVKSKDTVTSKARPKTQIRDLYASIVSQITIRTLHEIFESDRFQLVDSIVLSGYVDTIDPGTGLPIQPYLVSVRTTRETFEGIDLRFVDPAACLARLSATVSKSPAELAPVRPVLEFSMVDPRFIEEVDVISTLDQRPNLLELSPSEFESLISNLFEKMGLETRLTQASRDGGVDCVAFDPRPIFGGKVVIQAKRYKDTVGVSAVRDLYGTVQNEGASKGILVTTSGYGPAAYEFAAGKPLELLSGSHLLHLLEEYAGIEARIFTPTT